MEGQNELHELSDGAKRAIVNLIDTRIEERIRDLLPTREDFSELKSVVQDLALAVRDTQTAVKELTQAQGRTEQRVEELAQAQGRTEQRVEDLAQAQGLTEMEMRNLAKSVGKLSDAVGYGLEDVAHVVLPDLPRKRASTRLYPMSVETRSAHRFRVKAKHCGFRPGIDVGKLNQVADDLEAVDALRKANCLMMIVYKAKNP